MKKTKSLVELARELESYLVSMKKAKNETYNRIFS